MGAAQREVHSGGRPPLQFAQQLGIHAELENCRRLGVPGQLGIPDLVAPGAEMAWLFNPPQEIGEAQLPSFEEHRLIDDVGSIMHCRQRDVPPFGQALDKG